jgi:hypothetical protein
VDRVQLQAGERDFSLFHNVRKGFGANPTSYPKRTGVKLQELEADRSPPSRTEVRNGGDIRTPYVFMVRCLIN